MELGIPADRVEDRIRAAQAYFVRREKVVA
jgi:hypothetical protein